jgi:hypothetical protein
MGNTKSKNTKSKNTKSKPTIIIEPKLLNKNKTEFHPNRNPDLIKDESFETIRRIIEVPRIKQFIEQAYIILTLKDNICQENFNYKDALENFTLVHGSTNINTISFADNAIRPALFWLSHNKVAISIPFKCGPFNDYNPWKTWRIEYEIKQHYDLIDYNVYESFIFDFILE